ncbi:hypothetical protein Pmani_030601 [Petrolisthes manimaculis]|uniref:Uncharacterized protein n=1 Tax=Petrolisthes manimaculis TaxID=1843537 RepID=A0AAE1NX85_9EUCA|nr:hypothetical protein Pmani_030601 [Petrolisthes manimaculis]
MRTLQGRRWQGNTNIDTLTLDAKGNDEEKGGEEENMNEKEGEGEENYHEKKEEEEKEGQQNSNLIDKEYH